MKNLEEALKLVANEATRYKNNSPMCRAEDRLDAYFLDQVILLLYLLIDRMK
jgi:hypothetical protein